MKQKTCEVIILGAGVAGLAAAYRLRENGVDSLIIDKESDVGGLCRSFTVNHYTFDYCAHISFDNEDETYSLIEGNTKHWVHTPKPMNYSEGVWIQNPVWKHLAEVDKQERDRIVRSYLERKPADGQSDYASWLKTNFGNYYAENYPYKYTRKYWTVEPSELESNWIVGRMSVPTLKEIQEGCTTNIQEVHYSKEARYPREGGFQSFLGHISTGANVLTNQTVRKIDTAKRVVVTDDYEIEYQFLINTTPLDRLCGIMNDAPEEILELSKRLDHTSCALVSIGLASEIKTPGLWFYIYDEDVLPSRVFFPSNMAISNVPHGTSSVQAEVYFSKYKPLSLSLDEIKTTVIEQLSKTGLFEAKDVTVSDIRVVEYANVMFTPPIYETRERILAHIRNIGIKSAGRWGEWDYLWVGQSLRSGLRVAEEILKGQ